MKNQGKNKINKIQIKLSSNIIMNTTVDKFKTFFFSGINQKFYNLEISQELEAMSKSECIYVYACMFLRA